MGNLRGIAEGLLEAAWLTVSQYTDSEELAEECCLGWIDEYGEEMNDRLPAGVWFDPKTCEQRCDYSQGLDDVLLGEYEYEALQTKVEGIIDDRWYNRMKAD